MTNKPLNRDEVLAAVVERANSDSSFRASLLEDPSAALSEVVGMPVPDAVRITVYEESPTDIHLVIPAASSFSEEDLDLVSGGIDWSYPRTGPITCGCG